VFILCGLLFFFTSCAIFEIPHGALGLEMSLDPHERTRLFSAKSFLGNLFAMGTPWLILLANLEICRGVGGDLIDGMRYVSLIVAIVLIPLCAVWFLALREPGFELAKTQKKSAFWHDLRETVTNRTFLILTMAIFALAMGFNFVGNLANYITIFYLYGGDVGPASVVLGITGTVWAVSALFAVFPLNWIARRVGKRNALLIAILLMCAAQLSKIFCYHPGPLFTIDLPAAIFGDRTFTFQGPYLILIPTVLLSAGMLMFFTLGPSMVGDVCDEDELRTGTRSEGMFFSVFWWFIKMGTAFASLVAGFLIVLTMFDQKQNVLVDELQHQLDVIKADVQTWKDENVAIPARAAQLGKSLDAMTASSEKLRTHLNERLTEYPDQAAHVEELIQHNELLRSQVTAMRGDVDARAASPTAFVQEADALLLETTELKQQTPATLLRLRVVEIGVPLVLSCVSIFLTLCYPLTEARCFEIKAELEKRRGALAT
jgi:GPH family glycoside/pentoside/hexuronide:cation symporter